MKLASTLILDFEPLELGEIKVCRLSHSVYGIFVIAVQLRHKISAGLRGSPELTSDCSKSCTRIPINMLPVTRNIAPLMLGFVICVQGEYPLARPLVGVESDSAVSPLPNLGRSSEPNPSHIAIPSFRPH